MAQIMDTEAGDPRGFVVKPSPRALQLNDVAGTTGTGEDIDPGVSPFPVCRTYISLSS